MLKSFEIILFSVYLYKLLTNKLKIMETLITIIVCSLGLFLGTFLSKKIGDSTEANIIKILLVAIILLSVIIYND